MSRKRKYNKPFDLCHSILFNDFPAEYTSTIGVPGKFVKKINRRVHLKDGTTGEMDSAYIADPDYEILFERAAVALGHQTKPVGDSKLAMVGNYDIQLVVDEHLPTLMAFASHLNDAGSKLELVRTPSDIIKLYFLDLGEQNISERLSNVSKKIINEDNLTTEDALNLGVIVLYSPRNRACEITEEVVNLYLKIVNHLNMDMEYVLYSVISILLDAYYDDENEYRRIKNMLDNKTSSDSKGRFASHECTIESLKYAEEDLKFTMEKLDAANVELDVANEKLDAANVELDVANEKLDAVNVELDSVNHELDSVNHELDSVNHELDVVNQELAEANKKIAILEAENASLNGQLNGK